MPAFELKTGMHVQIGDMKGTVQEVGPPEEMRTWRGYNPDAPEGEELISRLQKSRVTLCAFILPDGYDKSVLIWKWRDYWWEPLNKYRIPNITVLSKPQ